jgi:hypothetical protein
MVLPPECLAPGSASHQALQESAFWWAQAVQLANDACDDEREALKAWDPEARTDDKEEICRLLAVDRGGYLRQARGAALRAVAWTHTPEERTRAKRQLMRLARAAGHRAAEPRDGEGARGPECAGRGSSREREPPVRQIN